MVIGHPYLMHSFNGVTSPTRLKVYILSLLRPACPTSKARRSTRLFHAFPAEAAPHLLHILHSGGSKTQEANRSQMLSLVSRWGERGHWETGVEPVQSFKKPFRLEKAPPGINKLNFWNSVCDLGAFKPVKRKTPVSTNCLKNYPQLLKWDCPA